MLKYSFIFIFSLIALTISAQEWEEFTDFEGQFRVVSPAVLTKAIDSIQTEVGTLAHHTFYFQSPDNQSDILFYAVSYFDYPAGAMHSDSLELLPPFFETTIEAAVEGVNGELRYSSEENFEEYPGRYWRIDYLNGQAVIKTQAFLVGNRYYEIKTISTRERAINPLSEQFIKSFRLLRR